MSFSRGTAATMGMARVARRATVLRRWATTAVTKSHGARVASSVWSRAKAVPRSYRASAAPWPLPATPSLLGALRSWAVQLAHDEDTYLTESLACCTQPSLSGSASRA